MFLGQARRGLYVRRPKPQKCPVDWTRVFVSKPSNGPERTRDLAYKLGEIHPLLRVRIETQMRPEFLFGTSGCLNPTVNPLYSARSLRRGRCKTPLHARHSDLVCLLLATFFGCSGL